jgi:hypothetical protein
MVSNAVEYQVIPSLTPREILLCVIDDAIRADRPDQIHIPRTADTSHLRAERCGDLYGERTHAIRRTVD